MEIDLGIAVPQFILGISFGDLSTVSVLSITTQLLDCLVPNGKTLLLLSQRKSTYD